MRPPYRRLLVLSQLSLFLLWNYCFCFHYNSSGILWRRDCNRKRNKMMVGTRFLYQLGTLELYRILREESAHRLYLNMVAKILRIN
jgi:hypothetical protein